MAGTSDLYNFVLKLLSDPSVAQSFLADPDNALRSVDVDDVIETLGQVAALWGTTSPLTVPAFVSGATAGSVLDTFVTGYYATNPINSSVWADGRVTQAFAPDGGIAVSAGKKVHDVVAATNGSVGIDGKTHDTGIALDGSIAAGDGNIHINDNDDVVIGDGNVRIEDGNDNFVIGDDANNIDGNGINVAGDNSTIQDASNGGINAGANAVRESNVAAGDQAIAGGDAYANDGNNAVGAESVATDGNVANVNNDGAATESALGAAPQAAGEDSNQVSDADVIGINQDVTFGGNAPGTGDAEGSAAVANQDNDFAPINLTDDDIIAGGYDDSRAIGDNSIFATGLVTNVAQDNDVFTNTQGGTAGDGGAAGFGAAGGGGITNSGAQSNVVDNIAATGVNQIAAGDEAITANDSSSAAGQVGAGGDGGQGTGQSGVGGPGAAGGSDNTAQAGSGNAVQADDSSVAAAHSNVAVSYGGDAATATDHSDIAQGDGLIADDHVYADGAATSFTDSYNDDFVHTEGNKSPGVVGDDHADMDDLHIHIDD